MPTIQHYSRSDARDKIWQAFDDDGAVIIDDFLAPELLDRLNREMRDAIEGHPPGTTSERQLWIDFHGTNTKRITGLPACSAGWVELLQDEIYREMGDKYLGKDDYHLNTGQLICIGPGETPQQLHRDALNWPMVAMNDYEVTVTAIFALTDFTAANGATVVAPGSNHWPGALPKVPPETCCQAEMPAGAALLYSGKVIHGGGANTTPNEWRVGLHAGFLKGWLRAEENFQLTVPWESAKTLPPDIQHLLDFRAYHPEFGGRLGLVDYDDPGRFLDAGRALPVRA